MAFTEISCSADARWSSPSMVGEGCSGIARGGVEQQLAEHAVLGLPTGDA